VFHDFTVRFATGWFARVGAKGRIGPIAVTR
jgi:hypothetical protein